MSEIPTSNLDSTKVIAKNRTSVSDTLSKMVGKSINISKLSSVTKSANKPTLTCINLPAGYMLKVVPANTAQMFCNSPYGDVWQYLPPETLSESLGEDGKIYIAGVEVRDTKVYYRGDVIIFAKKSNDDTIRRFKEDSFKKTLETYVGDKTDGKSRTDNFQSSKGPRPLEREVSRGRKTLNLTTQELLGENTEADDG